MANEQPTSKTLADRLLDACVAACTCLTKTPDIEHHDEMCTYRLHYEAWLAIAGRTADEPPALHAEIERLQQENDELRAGIEFHYSRAAVPPSEVVPIAVLEALETVLLHADFRSEDEWHDFTNAVTAARKVVDEVEVDLAKREQPSPTKSEAACGEKHPDKAITCQLERGHPSTHRHETDQATFRWSSVETSEGT